MLKVFELDIRKLIGFGSDGYSIMMGAKSDVIVRLRSSDCPCMMGFHYPAHRLQLGILDIAGKVYTQDMDLTLGRIHCPD